MDVNDVEELELDPEDELEDDELIEDEVAPPHATRSIAPKVDNNVSF
jgi:hypothetical protein